MKNVIEQLTNGIDNEIVNDIIEKAGKLNRNGQAELKSRLTEASPKIKKLAKAQRPAKINSIIDELLKTYAKKVKKTDAEKVDRRMTVLQIDKATNKVIAEHESVQAAHRNTGVSDGSICYCCLGKYGFKTAGGFKWVYKKDWTEPKPEAEVTE